MSLKRLTRVLVLAALAAGCEGREVAREAASPEVAPPPEPGLENAATTGHGGVIDPDTAKGPVR